MFSPTTTSDVYVPLLSNVHVVSAVTSGKVEPTDGDVVCAGAVVLEGEVVFVGAVVEGAAVAFSVSGVNSTPKKSVPDFGV